MFVGNPVFPISFKLEQVAGLVEETLLKKNWKSFEKGEIKLVLTPFYLFYYDAGFEEELRGHIVVAPQQRQATELQ